MAHPRRIPRYTDQEVYQRLQAVATDLGWGSATLMLTILEDQSPIEVGLSVEISQHPVLSEVFAAATAVIQRFQLMHNRNMVCAVSRIRDQLVDEFTTGEPSTFSQLFGNDENRVKGTAAFAIAIAKHVGALTMRGVAREAGASNLQVIDEFLEASRTNISQMQQLVSDSFTRLEKRETELRTAFEAKQAEGLAALGAQRQADEAKTKEEEEKLTAREAALDERAKELDLRDPKAARRAIQKELLAKLKELDAKFQLSPTTRRLRWVTHGVVAVAVALLAWFSWSNFSLINELVKAAGGDSTKISLPLLGMLGLKQLLGSAGLIALIWYYIRWTDRWAKQHADTEFELKQLELDVQRSGWLVELAMDWKNEKGDDFPTELLAQLGKGLFLQRERSEGEGPADLPSAILGAASGLKFKLGGAEVEMDRKGLKTLKE